MKNLFLLPTDKESKLYLGNLGKPVTIQSASAQLKKPLHIYITNDEDIKKGDWGYHTLLKGGCVIQSKYDEPNSTMKKIILTTDQDLIKNGVQAIDDEFLEWFVKNPSCELVEVKDLLSNSGNAFYGYKIIIPKEEPKQENCCTHIGQIKRYKDCVGCDRKPKQETLEEAGIIATGMCEHLDAKEQAFFIAGFIESAKWQQEQDKNKYSEEDMREAFRQGHKSARAMGSYNNITEQEDYNKWFEQFKKK
jgi:hypothetical protein